MALHPAYLNKPMRPSRLTLIIGLLTCIVGAVAMLFLDESRRASFPLESELESTTGQIERLVRTGGTGGRHGSHSVSRVVLHLEGQEQAFSFNPPKGFYNSLREIEETEGSITLHFLPSTHRVFRISTRSSDLLTREQAREGFNRVADKWFSMAVFFLVAAAIAAFNLIMSWLARPTER